MIWKHRGVWAMFWSFGKGRAAMIVECAGGFKKYNHNPLELHPSLFSGGPAAVNLRICHLARNGLSLKGVTL